MKRLAVVAPGFSADCLETLEELDMENRAHFLADGGEKFACVPCLNDSEPGHARHRAHRARRELMGVAASASRTISCKPSCTSAMRPQ